MRNLLLAVCVCVVSFAYNTLPAATAAADEAKAAKTEDFDGTRIAKWKDGKKAVFLLAFDDSCPSHLKNAIPELKKREIPGTFYVIAGNGMFKDHKQWADEAKSPFVKLGNHTMLHKDMLTVEQFDQDVKDANELINQRVDAKQPRLISFAQPGGVKWQITPEEKKQVLAKHNLIERPPFYGPPFHYKSLEEMTQYIDATIKKGEMGHLDFHGVGGDWLSTPMDQYLGVLDKLAASRDQIWLADAVAYHKYATERKSAEVKTIKSDDAEIQIQLSCKTDAALYDMPLTLLTKVPAGWSKCLVTQGANKSTVSVTDGVAQYDATPGEAVITLTKG